MQRISWSVVSLLPPAAVSTQDIFKILGNKVPLNPLFRKNKMPVTENEVPIWKGSPSQAINLPSYLACAMAAAAMLYFLGFSWLLLLLAPSGFAFKKWLEVESVQYELTNQRLRMRSGILNKKTQDMELYRVKDYAAIQPLALRAFGLSDILLESSDKSTPHVVLHAVKDAEALIDVIRENVEALRQRKGIREFNF